MGPILTDAHRRLLRMIFDRGAEGASLALSKWLGREVRLAVSDGRAGRAGRGRRAARPARDPGRRLRHGADRPAHRLAPPGLRGPLGPGAGRPAAAPADRHDHGLGRARAVGRQGDDQHRRLRVRQRPGRAPAGGDASDGPLGLRRAGPHAAELPATSSPAACSSSP